jgi:hypothetical protein
MRRKDGEGGSGTDVHAEWGPWSGQQGTQQAEAAAPHCRARRRQGRRTMGPGGSERERGGPGAHGPAQRNSTIFHLFKFFQTNLNLIQSKVIFWCSKIFK